MPTRRSGYTFSKLRLGVHVFLVIVTGFIWVPFGIAWEWFRYVNA